MTSLSNGTASEPLAQSGHWCVHTSDGEISFAAERVEICSGGSLVGWTYSHLVCAFSAGQWYRVFPVSPLFPPVQCHPSGWPLQTPDAFWKSNRPENEIANLKALLEFAPGTVKSELAAVWSMMGLGDYGDDEWKATLQWYRRSNP